MDQRPSARERGYTHRWDKARATFLNRHPLCRMCEQAGRVTAATVVDHIIPHRGDQALFWDQSNWQPLCDAEPWRCHSSTKQREERGAAKPKVGLDGWPA
jgi:5-methylcytosine-specific restriction protein A